jgi:hypothetical protein
MDVVGRAGVGSWVLTALMLLPAAAPFLSFRLNGNYFTESGAADIAAAPCRRAKWRNSSE